MSNRQSETSSAEVRVDPDFDRVLECVLGIHDHERRTYRAVLDAPGSTTSELAEDLDRDRSNVSRSLSTLVQKGLVERDRKILDGGGYVYQYFPLRPHEAKRTMHRAVEEWASRAHDRIDAFDA